MLLADYPGPKAECNYASAPKLECATPSELLAVLQRPERTRAWVQDMARPTGSAPPATGSTRAAATVFGSRKGSMGATAASRQRRRCTRPSSPRTAAGRALRRGDAGDGRPQRRRAARRADVIDAPACLGRERGELGLNEGCCLRAQPRRKPPKTSAATRRRCPTTLPRASRHWRAAGLCSKRAARCAACTGRFPIGRRWRCSTTARRSSSVAAAPAALPAARAPQPDRQAPACRALPAPTCAQAWVRAEQALPHSRLGADQTRSRSPDPAGLRRGGRCAPRWQTRRCGGAALRWTGRVAGRLLACATSALRLCGKGRARPPAALR